MTAVETERPSKVETPLFSYVRDRIAQEGPMPYDEYMAISLQGAVDRNGTFLPGYYSGAKPNIAVGVGEKDFSTAPELSPLFGFLLAGQIHTMRERMGMDKPFTVVEMGGGNGTMARDILTASREFYNDTHIKYKIVDSSPYLREKQREKLKDFDVEFVEGSALDSLPNDIEGVVLSNELFDDLPAKSIYRNDKGEWKELFVRQNPDPESPLELDNHWADATQEAKDYVARNNPKVLTGKPTIASVKGEKLMERIAVKLKRGFVLTIDYATTENGGTHTIFPPFKKNKWGMALRNSPLDRETFGKSGITARVDFEALDRVAKQAGINLELDQFTPAYFRDILGGDDLLNQLVELYGTDHESFNFLTGRGYRGVSEFENDTRAAMAFNHRIMIHSKGI